MSSRKLTGLPIPSLPKEAPKEFAFLLDEVLAGINGGEGEVAVAALQQSFRWLSCFFAGIAVSAAESLEVAYQLDQVEALAKEDDFPGVQATLKQALTCLGDKASDPLAKAVRTVFFVGSTRSQPTPRRHARLLELAGIPIRGYRLMSEWVALEPGVADLEGNSRCSRELRRYLPIYKEWVTAAANFYRDLTVNQRLRDEEGYRLEFNLADTDLVTPPLFLPAMLEPRIAGLITVAEAESEEVVEAEEQAESEEVVEAEEQAESEEVVEAEEQAESEEVVEAEEQAESEEAVEAEEQAETRRGGRGRGEGRKRRGWGPGRGAGRKRRGGRGRGAGRAREAVEAEEQGKRRG